MKAQPEALKRRSGYAHARLTEAEEKLVKAQAEMRGMTTSQWVRETLLEALVTSPAERRLMSFIATQTVAIRVSMEEWQAGKDLSNPTVQERIHRLAADAAREFLLRSKSGLPEGGGTA